MTDAVLVPVDGSPLSLEALRHALETFPDASITVLHVIDLFEPGYGAYFDFEGAYEPLMGTEEWYEQASEIEDALFEEVRTIAKDYDRKDIRTDSEVGDPRRIIVDFAEEEHIDHLVLGAHGRPDEHRALLGSVAEMVVRRTPVPVTLIR